MVRIREGMLAIKEMPEGSKKCPPVTSRGIRVKFQVVLSEDQARSILNTTLINGEAFFILGNKLLSQLHLTGVVKFPSVDQKFLSESNASARIKSQLIDFANGLEIYDITIVFPHRHSFEYPICTIF